MLGFFFIFFSPSLFRCLLVETVFPPPNSYRGNEPHPPFVKTLFYELIGKNCS